MNLGFRAARPAAPRDPPSRGAAPISIDEYPAAEFIARCRQLRHWDRQRAAIA